MNVEYNLKYRGQYVNIVAQSAGIIGINNTRGK